MATEPLDLLEKARHLTRLGREDGYAWSSADELLIVCPKSPGSGLLLLEQMGPRKVYCDVRRVRISTGEISTVAGFDEDNACEFLAEATITTGPEKDRLYARYKVAYFSVSPDGRSLVWLAEGGWRVASLNSGSIVRVPGQARQGTILRSFLLKPPVWLPDNRSWLDIKPGRIIIRSAYELESEQTIHVFNGEDGVPSGTTARGTMLIHHPCYDRDIIYGRKKLPTEMVFSEVKLMSGIRLARRFTVPLIVPGLIGSVPIAPDGNRIAWLFEDTLPPGSKHEYSIWISDLSGRECQKIGMTKGSNQCDSDSPAGTQHCHPRDIQWSPDGNQISFRYGEDLYAVPVAGDR